MYLFFTYITILILTMNGVVVFSSETLPLSTKTEAPTLTYGGVEPYTVLVSRVRPNSCKPEQFSKEGREQSFHRAVCLFHNSTSEENNDQAIRLLQENQKQGLPPVKQNFSSLIEGLLHCRQATLFFDKYKRSELKNLIFKARFCRERRVAFASFSDVSWEHAYFDYETIQNSGLFQTIPAFTLKDRIREMGDCHAGVLAPSLNAECGLISNLTETEMEGIVQNSVREVMIKYFEGAESPVTAMFARKVERATGLVKGADKRINEVQNRANPLNARYTKLLELYNSVSQPVGNSKLDSITMKYKQSVLLSQSILDEYERWKGGLFITSENVNLLPKIKERSNIELSGELNRITQSTIIPKIQKMLEDIKILASSDVAYKKQIKQICQIYFCELINKKNLPNIIRLCRKPSMNSNPMCIGLEGNNFRNGIVVSNFEEGHYQKTVLELCQEAGLPIEYLKIGLGKEESTKCLAGF